MVIDFGLSCMRSENESEKEQQIHCRWGGTYNYMAPELIKYKLDKEDKPLDLEMIKRADIFSLGIVFWILITNKYPYIPIYSPKQLKKNIDKNKVVIMEKQYLLKSLLNFWENNRDLEFNIKVKKNEVYDKLNKIVRKMLSVDPNTRPTMNEIVNELEIIINESKEELLNIVSPLSDTLKQIKWNEIEGKNENEQEDNLLKKIDNLLRDLRTSIDETEIRQETVIIKNGEKEKMSEFSYKKYYDEDSDN